MGGGGRGRHVKLRVTRTGEPDATDSRRKAVQELIGKRGGKNSHFVLEAGGEGGDLGGMRTATRARISSASAQLARPFVAARSRASSSAGVRRPQ